MAKKAKKSTRGGAREGAGRRTLFPGKVKDGKIVGVKRSVVFTQTAHEALSRVVDTLSAREGFPVSEGDAIEYCVRRQTRTPLAAA